MHMKVHHPTRLYSEIVDSILISRDTGSIGYVQYPNPFSPLSLLNAIRNEAVPLLLDKSPVSSPDSIMLIECESHISTLVKCVRLLTKRNRMAYSDLAFLNSKEPGAEGGLFQVIQKCGIDTIILIGAESLCGYDKQWIAHAPIEEYRVSLVLISALGKSHVFGGKSQGALARMENRPPVPACYSRREADALIRSVIEISGSVITSDCVESLISAWFGKNESLSIGELRIKLSRELRWHSH